MKRSRFHQHGRDVAKPILICLGVVLLFGWNDASADFDRGAIKRSVTFSISTGDGYNSLPDISFGAESDELEEAQTTCAMTPGGSASHLYFEEPIVPLMNPGKGVTPQQMLAPISSLRTPPPYDPSRSYRPTVPGGPGRPKDDPSVTPEPATVLLMGLGIAGLVFSRRMRK